MPSLRKGLVDKLIDNPKEERLKDEILIVLAYQAVVSAGHTGVAPYALEVAALIKDDAKKKALYKEIVETYGKKDISDDGHNSERLEARLEAFYRIQPQSSEEENELKKRREEDTYEYAQSKLAEGDVEKARKFFELCGAQEMIDVIDRIKNPKKLLKAKYDKRNEKGEQQGQEPTCLDDVLKKMD